MFFQRIRQIKKRGANRVRRKDLVVVGVALAAAIGAGIFYGPDLMERYGPHNDAVVTEHRTASEITNNVTYHLTRKACQRLTAETRRDGTFKSSTCQ